MSVRYPKVALDGENIPERLFKLAQAINGLLDGNSNNALEVTLAPNVASTTLSDDRVHPETVPILTPKTASAAVAAPGIYCTAGNKAITINHGVYLATDMRFGVVLCG